MRASLPSFSKASQLQSSFKLTQAPISASFAQAFSIVLPSSDPIPVFKGEVLLSFKVEEEVPI